MGRLGRAVTRKLLPLLKAEMPIDLVIANGENSASGYGITASVYKELIDMGIDCITMGNHMFDKREFVRELENADRLVRPANYPPDVPGRDHLILKVKDVKVAVMNLLGRVFMPAMDCPFRTGEALLKSIKSETPIVIVDIHAEATSEKCAIGYYFDGKVSAVIGTHTHVMTADDRILDKGTAYISDAGMVGALDSIIGMDREQIISRFLTQMPNRFEPVIKGKGLFNGVYLKIDTQTGKAKEIKRVCRTTEVISAEKKEGESA